MADKKISALTAATTPLAGTEVLPIVQSGTTVKVSVDNLTAGRSVSATSITNGLGAVGTPSYTFTGDLNTGMWSPAADTIAFSEGGVEAMRITPAADVGVGTTTPTSRLAVSGGNATAVTVDYNAGISTGAEYSALRFTASAVGFVPAEIRAVNTNGGQNLGVMQLFTSGSERMRITSGGDITASTGNLVLGTAGKGIDFSANTHAPGMTSELLNWYEEGTYTPTVTSGSGTITSYTATALYTRIGRQVTVNANITITDAGTGGGVCTVTLPFANNGTVIGNGTGRENAITGSQLQASISLSASTMDVRQYNNATVVATNAQIRVTATYFV